MDSNPIHHPSPAKKNEMLVFRLRSLLMICLADWWTWTLSATPLQPKKWNAHFWITFNFWWLAGLVDGLKPHLPPFFSEKMKSSFLDYVQLLMINQAGQWTRTPSASPLQPIKWNFHYVQLLMISQAGQWTWTPSATPLHPKKWNDHFWITFNFWWLAGLVDGLKPHPPQLFSQKMKSSFLDYVQLLMISQAGQWTRTPSATPLQPKKWNAHFWIMFNFRLLAWQVDGLKPHLPALSN